MGRDTKYGLTRIRGRKIKDYLVFSPKVRFGPEFINRLNHTAQIMRQHFTEGFIDLRRARLASQSVAKLGLDHQEGGFDV